MFQCQTLSKHLSLHAFTGCDTVSAFSGRGKVSALNLMAKESRYIELFKSIGEAWDVSPEISSGVEEFVCKLYGYQIDDVNLLRYKLYCSKKGIIDCEKLPPCKSSLDQHLLRANYQSCGNSSQIPSKIYLTQMVMGG